jgi:uncharacterized surface protein with fasciclin (FAS1) repeats
VNQTAQDNAPPYSFHQTAKDNPMNYRPMNYRIAHLLLVFSLMGLFQLTPVTVVAAPAQQEMPDIVETAIAAEGFETLVTALEAAGLVETLQGEGPFTVFAPTDEAFAALPPGTVEALLADPEGALTDVLLYHVVAGSVTAADAVNAIGDSLEMANGLTTTLTVEGSRLLLNNAGFLVMNIQAANGVIHVIDQVLLPPATTEAASTSTAEATAVATEAAPEEAAPEATPETEAPAADTTASDSAAPTEAQDETAQADIIDTAIAAGNFETLVAAVQAADLVETLKGAGPFTLFAPTDAAFAKLPEGTVEALLTDPSGPLSDILLYHVVPGQLMAADVIALDGETVATVGGPAITIMVAGNVVMVDDALLTATDIETANGVIHVIDMVLIPSSTSAATAEASTESSAATAAASTESNAASMSGSAATDPLAACDEVYYVQRGDTLSQIAASYGVNLQTLIQINNIVQPNLIYRGQAICIQH